MTTSSRRTKSGNPLYVQSQKRLITLWMLRAFTGGRNKLIFSGPHEEIGFTDEEIAVFLNLPNSDQYFKGDDHYDQKSKYRYKKFIFDTLDTRLAKLEADIDRCCFSPTVAQNIELIASTIGLNVVETRVLEFFLCMHRVPALNDIIRIFVSKEMEGFPEFISRILALSESKVAKALNQNSRLCVKGLLCSRGESHPSFFSKEVAGATFASKLDESSIIRELLNLAPASNLTIDDYPHLIQNTKLLIPYLKRSLERRRKGVNIYLYGPPGTGKTEFARLLCDSVGAKGYEAIMSDSEGDPAHNRTYSLRASAAFLKPADNVLIFDEAEDLFSADSPTSGSKAGKNKAWFNRFLETNPIPIIWISNDISDLDTAFTRRFDFVFEVPVPPKRHREKTITKILGNHFDTGIIRRLSCSETLSPAVVARARSVVQGLSKKEMESGVSLLISNTMKAQGHEDPMKHHLDKIDQTVYDMSYLNSSADLVEIVEGFRTNPSGRICLHGAPGTGKTAFAHYLAENLSIPLHLKKASDLLSPFLGQTEHRMSQAFSEAQNDRAILLIDEVDSFLRDRSLAQRSWEVTQTNEFLMQLESYEGIFIATTNLRENLDPACLRRFDLKLHFGTLESAQAQRLLVAHCLKLGIAEPSATETSLLSATSGLTPGDFATVTRQARFRKIRNAGEYVERLTDEISMKSGNSRAIGFNA